MPIIESAVSGAPSRWSLQGLRWPAEVIRRLADRACRRLDVAVLYESTVGIKRLNQLISSETFGRWASGEARRIPAGELFLGFDGLRDSHTLLETPLERSPHYELMRRLAGGGDPGGSEYVLRASRGTLDSRPSQRVDGRALGFIRKTYEERVRRVQAGDYPPVKIVTTQGRHYIADGKHTAALCAAAGLAPLCVDASPLACDSYFWWVYRKMSRREGRYGKHLAYFRRLLGPLPGRPA